MVSIRCKMMVKAELEKLGLHHGIVDLGEVEVREFLTADQRDHLKTAFEFTTPDPDKGFFTIWNK
jgi:hypothetical protein